MGRNVPRQRRVRRQALPHKGSKWLRATLTEAAAKTKNSYLAAQYQRYAAAVDPPRPSPPSATRSSPPPGTCSRPASSTATSAATISPAKTPTASPSASCSKRFGHHVTLELSTSPPDGISLRPQPGTPPGTSTMSTSTLTARAEQPGVVSTGLGCALRDYPARAVGRSTRRLVPVTRSASRRRRRGRPGTPAAAIDVTLRASALNRN
jgi:hypothetical protein